MCPPPPSTFCPHPRLPQPHPPWSPPYLTSHSISVCFPEQAWPCFLPHCTSPLAWALHRDTHASKVPDLAHGCPPVLLPQTSCWSPCLGLPLIWLHKHIFPSTTLACPVIPWSSAFGSSLLRKSGFETFQVSWLPCHSVPPPRLVLSQSRKPPLPEAACPGLSVEVSLF